MHLSHGASWMHTQCADTTCPLSCALTAGRHFAVVMNFQRACQTQHLWLQDKTLLFIRNMYSLQWQSATEAIEQWSSGAIVPAVLASLEGSSQPRDTSIVHALYCLSNSAAKGKSIPFSLKKLFCIFQMYISCFTWCADLIVTFEISIASPSCCDIAVVHGLQSSFT